MKSYRSMSTIRSVNRPFLNTMNLTKLSKWVHSETNSNRIRRYKFRNIHRREDRIELFSQGSGSICHLIGHNSDVKLGIKICIRRRCRHTDFARTPLCKWRQRRETYSQRGTHGQKFNDKTKFVDDRSVPLRCLLNISRMQSTPTRVANGKSANCHCARISNVCANIQRCYRRNCAISGVKWSEIYFRIHCRCVHLFQEYIC